MTFYNTFPLYHDLANHNQTMGNKKILSYIIGLPTTYKERRAFAQYYFTTIFSILYIKFLHLKTV